MRVSLSLRFQGARWAHEIPWLRLVLSSLSGFISLQKLERPAELDTRRPLNRSVHSFPNRGGDAVSGGTRSPQPIANCRRVSGSERHIDSD